MQMKKTVLVIAGLMVAAIIGVTLYPSVTHLSSFTVSIDPKESQVLPHLTLEQSTGATSVYDRHEFAQGVTESVSKVAETNVKFVNKEVHMQNYSQLFHEANHLHSLKEKLQILPITCFPGSEGLFPKKYTKFLLALAEYAPFHSNTSNVRKLIWKCGHQVACVEV